MTHTRQIMCFNWFIISFFKAIITVFAYTFEEIYQKGQGLMSLFAVRDEYAEVLWCSLFAFLFFFYYRSGRNCVKHNKEEAIWAIVFSMCMLLGRSFSIYNSWELVFASHRQIILSIFAGFGWWVLFYELLIKISTVVVTKFSELVVTDCKLGLERSLQVRFFCVILLCWLPYIVVFFPGNVPHDGMRQLSEWFRYRELTNHHPFFTTLIFGTLMKMGQNINDNAGVFLIILVQVLLCALIYTNISIQVKKYCGLKASWMTCLFFAVVPMWGSYAGTVIKDTLFSAVYALCFSSYIAIFDLDTGSENPKQQRIRWLSFFMVNLIVCLIRNDGIYRTIPSIIVLWIAVKRNKKRYLFAVLFSLIVVLTVYNSIVFNALGVSKGNSREMLSIPFQQTARYVRDCSDDITEEEADAIRLVMPLDNLKELYNPEVSDPVKDVSNIYSEEAFKEYIKAWFSMGARHLGVYAQATLNNSYGYFYPFRISRVRLIYHNYIKGEPINMGFEIYYLVSESVRNKLSDWEELWLTFPGISLLSNPGTYTWLVFIGIMLLVKIKRYRELSVTALFVLHIAICIASPVNGLLRYAMPLMACMPLFMAWVMYKRKE